MCHVILCEFMYLSATKKCLNVKCLLFCQAKAAKGLLEGLTNETRQVSVVVTNFIPFGELNEKK